MTPTQAIRAKCLDCADNANEVKLCPIPRCPLYPFRFGKNPNIKGRSYTEDQLMDIKARLPKNRKK